MKQNRLQPTAMAAALPQVTLSSAWRLIIPGAVLFVAIAIVMVLPTMALAYEGMKPQSSPVTAADSTDKKAHKQKVGSVEQMLLGLRTKLEQEPGDMKGWVLLARSYHHIGDWHEAEKAAAKARALGYEGDLFPGEKSQAVAPVDKPRAKMPNDHNHRSVGKAKAGTYVSSFFETLESESDTTGAGKNQ